MELSKNQWHVKFYFWCLDVWDAYTESYTDRCRSNLCQYIRTIFVWMPLAIATQLAFYALAFYVLLYFPATHFSVPTTAKTYGVISIVVGAIWLFGIAKSWLEEQDRKRGYEAFMESLNEEPVERAEPVVAEPAEEKGPGFIEVVWTYLVAAKRKVCPIIEFNNPQKETV